jgi:hypothetical protein
MDDFKIHEQDKKNCIYCEQFLVRVWQEKYLGFAEASRVELQLDGDVNYKLGPDALLYRSDSKWQRLMRMMVG